MFTIGALSLSSIALVPAVASASTMPEGPLSGVTYSTETVGAQTDYVLHFPNGRNLTLSPTGTIAQSEISYSTSEDNGHLYITVTFPNGKSITVDPPEVTD